MWKNIELEHKFGAKKNWPSHVEISQLFSLYGFAFMTALGCHCMLLQ